jgi:hypothetical protein
LSGTFIDSHPLSSKLLFCHPDENPLLPGSIENFQDAGRDMVCCPVGESAASAVVKAKQMITVKSNWLNG